MIKNRSLHLSIYFCLFLPVSVFSQTVEGKVTAFADSVISIDVGSENGIKKGMSGKIFYETLMKNKTTWISFASFEITEVRRFGSMAKIENVTSRELVGIGQKVVIDLSSVREIPTPGELTQLLKEAYSLYESGNIIESLELYNIVIESFPDNNEAKNMIKIIENEIIDRTANPYSTLKDADYAPEMVFISGGEFMMGSDKGDDDERPVHPVKVDTFYIGKHEVTQGEWKAVMGSNPSKFKGDDLPVESVSWNDAREYLKKLSDMTGHNYRLPTEAEWEYACRAGSAAEYSFGNDESQLDKYAWYGPNSNSKTHPVCQKEPNAWGLYDMHGNVWEWCSDWYGPLYLDYPSENPKGVPSGRYRVIRGGNWGMGSNLVRAAYRYYFDPFYRVSGIGFRCVREK